ncbi:hypothetical protein [Dokdonella fugitiva]|uniref:hypothetical protein n=1 Tax=Dokdonella fugitiva TaxID=328517 RepID=UPI0015FBEBB9|nr:hypothetical protein [Dokdonella fugitiva]MBA8885115.1 SAM-dependent methyltransferase [Dokdonella fugitiva]
MNHEYDDEQLERVHGEIRAQAAALARRPLLPRSRAAVEAGEMAPRIDSSRLSYAVGELTDAHHRAFVDGAFRALLKRTPTAAESAAAIARLARGAAKAEVLGDLRWSAEGRRVGARVAGLAPRYALAKLHRIPLLGPLVDGLLALAGAGAQQRHVRAMETYFAARDEDTRATLDALGVRADHLEANVALLGQRIDDLHAFVHQLVLAREADARTIAAIEVALRTRVESLEQASEAQRNKLGELEFVRDRFYAINHWLHRLEETFAEVERVADAQVGTTQARAARIALQAAAGDAAGASRHAGWEARLAPVLPAHARVVALACDPDWTRRLAAHGFEVSCVQPDPVLAREAHGEGVVVEVVDARAFLERCADASVDALTVPGTGAIAAQLPVLELLGLAHRVLRPGGALLLADAHGGVAATAAELAGQARDARLERWSAALFAAAGFADAARIDAADGTPAWLLRRETP